MDDEFLRIFKEIFGNDRVVVVDEKTKFEPKADKKECPSCNQNCNQGRECVLKRS